MVLGERRILRELGFEAGKRGELAARIDKDLCEMLEVALLLDHPHRCAHRRVQLGSRLHRS